MGGDVGREITGREVQRRRNEGKRGTGSSARLGTVVNMRGRKNNASPSGSITKPVDVPRKEGNTYRLLDSGLRKGGYSGVGGVAGGPTRKTAYESSSICLRDGHKICAH